MIEAERLAFADVLESLGPDDWVSIKQNTFGSPWVLGNGS